MKIDLLCKEISKVCPIDGCSSVDEIWFKPEATLVQKTLAWDIYNNWVDPKDPDVTGFAIALSQNQVINSWYEELPKMVTDQLAIYLNEQRFDEIELIIESLTIPQNIKELINQYCETFAIPLSM